MFYCLEVRKVQKMAIVYCIFFQVMVRFKELKKRMVERNRKWNYGIFMMQINNVQAEL